MITSFRQQDQLALVDLDNFTLLAAGTIGPRAVTLTLTNDAVDQIEVVYAYIMSFVYGKDFHRSVDLANPASINIMMTMLRINPNLCDKPTFSIMYTGAHVNVEGVMGNTLTLSDAKSIGSVLNTFPDMVSLSLIMTP